MYKDGFHLQSDSEELIQKKTNIDKFPHPYPVRQPLPAAPFLSLIQKCIEFSEFLGSNLEKCKSLISVWI